MIVAERGILNVVDLKKWLVGKSLKCKRCACGFTVEQGDAPNISVAEHHTGSYSGPESIHYTKYIFHTACPRCGIAVERHVGKDFIEKEQQAA